MSETKIPLWYIFLWACGKQCPYRRMSPGFCFVFQLYQQRKKDHFSVVNGCCCCCCCDQNNPINNPDECPFSACATSICVNT